MPETSIKRRLRRARKQARRILESQGWLVFESADSLTDLIAIAPITGRARLVRVALNGVSKPDADFARTLGGVSIEMWSRLKGQQSFVINHLGGGRPI